MKAAMLPILALTAAITISLAGCNAQDTDQAPAVEPAKQSSLSVFLGLHKQFCEQDFSSRELLVSALQADKRFRPAPGFMGVYETSINGISYAVSPEVDGCTTDVMVQNKETGEVLFSYDEMNQALLAKGYQTVGEVTTRQDMGSDQQEVTILEKTFVSPLGETTNLDYPQDRLDKYYMTLFAKKFSQLAPSEALSLNN